MSVHIGKEIKKKVEERKKTVVGLSRELGCHRTNVYRIFESPTVDSGILSRLSVILDYDFFSLYSEDIRSKINQNREK
ncbi:MAG: XRE family transcriptional regulator [Bacteroidales bacterium]|nr:XRE family transcriptional regulator [Bacteroidales bacterium]